MKNCSWKLENAQKIADEYPYTFHKPSNEVISRLKVGNQVKIIFEFDLDDPDAPRAERMWIEITEVTNNGFRGFLDNDPVYIKDLKYKDLIDFNKHNIIDTDIDDPVQSITDKYINRCFVTNNILYEGQSVGYLYREQPDCEDDSGWRINAGTETDEYMADSDNFSYVSLGAVLREDDSFIDLLEREAGSAFAKNDEDDYVELA